MRVRKHCGGYAESMATTQEVINQAQLDAYFGEPVVIDTHRTFDPRNGWMTHYVFDINRCILGMTDGGGFSTENQVRSTE